MTVETPNHRGRRRFVLVLANSGVQQHSISSSARRWWLNALFCRLSRVRGRGFCEGTIRAKRSSGLGPSRELNLEPSWSSTKAQIRSHIFRIWTACAVLAVYVYGWFYIPEVLTWWKRTTTGIIETGCNLLPYPWGDRIEATLGNFGLWVQITLAIIVFRILVWLVIVAVRRPRGGRGPPPERPQSLRVKGPE